MQAAVMPPAAVYSLVAASQCPTDFHAALAQRRKPMRAPVGFQEGEQQGDHQVQGGVSAASCSLGRRVGADWASMNLGNGWKGSSKVLGLVMYPAGPRIASVVMQLLLLLVVGVRVVAVVLPALLVLVLLLLLRAVLLGGGVRGITGHTAR